MQYNKVVEGKFISRPNRFIAHVEIDGVDTVVHVKNTGRCRELLQKGVKVYLEQSKNPERKTPFDLIVVEKNVNPSIFGKERILINMDSQAPNKAAGEWIKSNNKRFPIIRFLKPEYTFGNSRFDFYIEYKTSPRSKIHKMFLEVKGVTLENNGAALFPDAPTERGIKHLTELSSILQDKLTAEDGTRYECGILFLIQMKGCKTFSPSYENHPEFCVALNKANKACVEIFVVDCKITPESMTADKPVKLVL